MQSIELTSTPWSPTQMISALTARHRCRSARWKSIALLSLLSLTGLAEVASATDATEASSGATDSGGLSEITVTAAGFKPTSQTTPISISAPSGDQLAAPGTHRNQR